MPTMTIKPIFSYGEIVYHITDPEQCKGLVVGYEVHPKGLKYIISFNGNPDSFYAFELSNIKGEVTDKREDAEEDEE